MASAGYKINLYTRVENPMTNKITNSLLALAAGGLILTGSAIAQTTTSTTSGGGAGVVDAGHPRVNQVNGRETHQQKRIANGINSGKLTPVQASHLEKGEARLQNNEQKDMAADNGHLTKKDQRQLNHEANHMSKRIHNAKQ
jgi:uncharacterized lipoprotein YajG